MTSQTRISVVMPCLNAAGTIQKSILSASNQSTPPFEIIVADGGSTDGTREDVEQMKGVRLLGGTDDGMYEGLNRAIDAARGDYIILLNADDSLPSDTLRRYSQAIDTNPSLDICTGSALFQGDLELLVNPESKMTPASTLHGIPCMNSRLFRRSIFDQTKFEQGWGMAADRVFIHDLSRRSLHRMCIDVTTYIYQAHSGSMSLDQSSTTRTKVRSAELSIAKRLRQRSQGCEPSYQRELDAFLLAQTIKSGKIGALLMGHKNGLSISRSATLFPRTVWRWFSNRGRMCGW